MIHAESGIASYHAVITEQAASQVANEDVAPGPGASALCGIEHFSATPEQGTAARNLNLLRGHFLSHGVIQGERRVG